MDLDVTPFVQAGIAGPVLVWFMVRLEKKLSRLDATMHLMARTLIRQLEQSSSMDAADLSEQLFDLNKR